MKPSRLSEAQLGIAAAALSGDSGLLYGLAADLLDDGTPFDVVLFDILLGSEVSVGARWQTGDYLVSEEHAATATLETVISLLAGSFDQPDGPSVVVAAVEGDRHSLPGRAVAASLLSRGYRTVFLGGNVPASDLRDFLMSEPPDAVVLSCAMSTHLLGARAAIRESHTTGLPVLVGGRGFGPNGVWAAPVGADAWVPSGGDAFDMLSRWNPDPSGAERLAHDPGDIVRMVLDRRHSVLATAEEWLTLSGTSIGPRVRSEAELLLDAVVSAILVSDRTLVDEFLAWQRKELADHGVDAPLAEAVSIGLVPIEPKLAAWLNQTV
jgi:MerR family transcriptional regulator, light-induced transcriptional regulator